jgi:nucleoside-diphosphate-sugar epimerase
MSPAHQHGSILVTGASGQIGSALCRLLRGAKRTILPIDLTPEETHGVVACDLRRKQSVTELFQCHRIHAVIHVAGALPSAFQADPLAGADLNVNGSITLLEQAIATGVRRFVFASSMSAYGTRETPRALTEDDPAVPDDPYGVSKRTIELVGEALAEKRRIEFVALRICRVVGPGITKSSSLWRSQICEPSPQAKSILLPYSPQAKLSLVHGNEVARMLMMLADRGEMSSSIYNTPAEIWTARQLQELIEEARSIPVELMQGGPDGGPICDGSRFVREFGFQTRALREYLVPQGA